MLCCVHLFFEICTSTSIFTGDLLIFLNLFYFDLVLILVLAFVDVPAVTFFEGENSVRFLGTFCELKVKYEVLEDLGDYELRRLGGLTDSEIKEICF